MEDRAPEVIEHHSRYWRGIMLNLVGNAVTVGFVVGSAWLAMSVFGVQNRDLRLATFRFELPAATAMSAFGVLATLIVALQVGVRVPFADERAPAAAARQMSLETLARLCGASALAVGLAATLAQPLPWSAMDPVRYVGPVAGALLLAVFAGDAASASSARLSQAISDERKTASIKRLASARDALEASSEAPRLTGYALQLIVGLVAIPFAMLSLLLALWGLDSWQILPPMIFWAGFSIALGSALLVVTKALWTRRAFVESVYFAAIVLLCGAAVAVMAFVLQPGPWPSDFRDVFWRSSVAAIVSATWAVACLSLAGRLPFSTVRGVGAAVLMWTFQSEIDRHRRGPRPVISGIVGLILLSFVLPPAGIAAASRRRRVDGSRSDAAFWVAGSVLCAWVAALIVLLALNPSFA